MTYVGSPGQRRAAALSADAVAGIPEAKQEKLAADLRLGKSDSGHAADVIETVAQQVVQLWLTANLQCRNIPTSPPRKAFGVSPPKSNFCAEPGS